MIPKLLNYKMAERLLCSCLLMVLLCFSLAKEQTCATYAFDCDECIQSGPQCAWCTAPGSEIHCNTLEKLQRAGCHKDNVYNPQGSVQVVKNDSSTEPVDKSMFLQPQELSLRLRPGVSQSFPLTVIMPTDQAITELTMDTSPMPEGVNVTFSSIVNGNPLILQVSVEAAWCPIESDDSSQTQNRNGPRFVLITPRGFSLSVKLEINLECQCNCTRDREENSPSCSGHGALVCGKCDCQGYYFGDNCDWKDDQRALIGEDACRRGPNDILCSGNGKCVWGDCVCKRRVNKEERYSGKYCECNNFDCPYSNNRLCGGHGRCECGRCICDELWTGEDCSCSLETASCTASNRMLCNGRGTCECGTCKCSPPHAGPTCEFCPTCPGQCSRHMDCVECLAFGTGRKKNRCKEECGYLTVTMVESKHDIPEPEDSLSCKMRSSADGCFVYYDFSSTPSGGQSTVARAKECPSYFS